MRSFSSCAKNFSACQCRSFWKAKTRWIRVLEVILDGKRPGTGTVQASNTRDLSTSHQDQSLRFGLWSLVKATPFHESPCFDPRAAVLSATWPMVMELSEWSWIATWDAPSIHPSSSCSQSFWGWFHVISGTVAKKFFLELKLWLQN